MGSGILVERCWFDGFTCKYQHLDQGYIKRQDAHKVSGGNPGVRSTWRPRTAFTPDMDCRASLSYVVSIRVGVLIARFRDWFDCGSFFHILKQGWFVTVDLL